jgi:hypothetical protein
MAVYGFRGLGWFVCGVTVAIGSYMATSQGAVERARLEAVEASIIAAKKEIRSLETEFNTRANMVQLGEWNGVLQLAAPAPAQYLPDEEALASLDQPAPAPAVASDEPASQQARLVIPAGAPKPLETALAKVDAAKTAAAEQRDGLVKARSQAVAMIDEKLFDDLKKRAQDEQLKLR